MTHPSTALCPLEGLTPHLGNHYFTSMGFYQKKQKKKPVVKTFLFVIIGRRQLCDQFFHFLLKHLFLPSLWSEDSQNVFKNLNNNVVIFLSNIKIKFKSILQLFFFPYCNFCFCLLL